MTEQELIERMIEDPECPLTRADCVWEVCPQCHGEGVSSAYLGAYTESEWYEMDEEWRDGYMAGHFDKVCTTCEGRRVVLEVGAVMAENREVQAALADWAETESMYRMEREAGA
jgi:hypothetical protein